MSYRLGDAAGREEGDEQLFETASSVSGGDSDDDDDDEGDQFPDGGGGAAGDGAGGGDGDCSCDGQDRRAFVPRPLRRMNSDSIYDMTSMMSQLPAKKGLSRYYDGKSQSFACMSEVRCLEDLRKKDNPYKQRKMKPCKSYVALGGMATKKQPASSLDLVVAAANGFRTPPIPNGYHQ